MLAKKIEEKCISYKQRIFHLWELYYDYKINAIQMSLNAFTLEQEFKNFLISNKLAKNNPEKLLLEKSDPNSILIEVLRVLYNSIYISNPKVYRCDHEMISQFLSTSMDQQHLAWSKWEKYWSKNQRKNIKLIKTEIDRAALLSFWKEFFSKKIDKNKLEKLTIELIRSIKKEIEKIHFGELIELNVDQWTPQDWETDPRSIAWEAAISFIRVEKVRSGTFKADVKVKRFLNTPSGMEGWQWKHWYQWKSRLTLDSEEGMIKLKDKKEKRVIDQKLKPAQSVRIAPERWRLVKLWMAFYDYRISLYELSSAAFTIEKEILDKLAMEFGVDPTLNLTFDKYELSDSFSITWEVLRLFQISLPAKNNLICRTDHEIIIQFLRTTDDDAPLRWKEWIQYWEKGGRGLIKKVKANIDKQILDNLWSEFSIGKIDNKQLEELSITLIHSIRAQVKTQETNPTTVELQMEDWEKKDKKLVNVDQWQRIIRYIRDPTPEKRLETRYIDGSFFETEEIEEF